MLSQWFFIMPKKPTPTVANTSMTPIPTAHAFIDDCFGHGQTLLHFGHPSLSGVGGRELRESLEGAGSARDVNVALLSAPKSVFIIELGGLGIHFVATFMKNKNSTAPTTTKIHAFSLTSLPK